MRRSRPYDHIPNERARDELYTRDEELPWSQWSEFDSPAEFYQNGQDAGNHHRSLHNPSLAPGPVRVVEYNHGYAPGSQLGRTSQHAERRSEGEFSDPRNGRVHQPRSSRQESISPRVRYHPWHAGRSRSSRSSQNAWRDQKPRSSEHNSRRRVESSAPRPQSADPMPRSSEHINCSRQRTTWDPRAEATAPRNQASSRVDNAVKNQPKQTSSNPQNEPRNSSSKNAAIKQPEQSSRKPQQPLKKRFTPVAKKIELLELVRKYRSLYFAEEALWNAVSKESRIPVVQCLKMVDASRSMYRREKKILDDGDRITHEKQKLVDIVELLFYKNKTGIKKKSSSSASSPHLLPSPHAGSKTSAQAESKTQKEGSRPNQLFFDFVGAEMQGLSPQQRPGFKAKVLRALAKSYKNA